jgi:hypothetical protein
MKRVTIFLILLITAIAALIAATIIGFAVFSSLNQSNPYNWMGQMWGSQNGATNGMGGGMMGQTPTPQTATSAVLPYFGAVFALLIAVSIVGVVGVAYYLVYPQIRMGNTSAALTQSSDGVAAYESVAKTLTEDERKIIEALKAHQGKYLQKYIKAETGLSRLQTHRVIARLSERGIVTLEKTGNTNQVQLADWLNQKQ